MLENPVTNEHASEDQPNDKLFVKEVLKDYKTCVISREASLRARKEVLTGKAKFGIIGDGKEVPQVALARAFKKGDWRSGYYRDQTIMFALDLCSIEGFFAQLYADPENDPFSGGRQMNAHFATPMVDENGEWTDHNNQYNISSDISSTGGQMPRAVGLALASKLYRDNPSLQGTNFSIDGNEVCFVTIGDASTSEGVFWESVNAAGVMQIPIAISVWDDGYGISVPKKYQTTKESISEIMQGFKTDENHMGFEIFTCEGWDYPALCEMYAKGIAFVREHHRPVLFHIQELTQPQGHSTSGSHERYKSKERLEWERAHDCNLKMRNWILETGIATEENLQEIEKSAKEEVLTSMKKAWEDFMNPVKISTTHLKSVYANLIDECSNKSAVETIAAELDKMLGPLISEVAQNARQMLFEVAGQSNAAIDELKAWLANVNQSANKRYHTNLYSNSKYSALKIPVVPAVYSDDSVSLTGYQILNKCFDHALETIPNLFAFGEDVGYIGDVNQGFAGMQEKYGKERVFDTGIRELTIMGQAIGMSMRGLRPIAEIQYLDYLIYGLQPLSDDLATLRYRSNGIQQAPAIIRTRGHRLEGIWHAGSPLGMMINSLRGVYICVPRNMTQAVGFYHTLLKSDDPAIVIECLNGYRLKEKMPDNLTEFTVPLGVPEVLEQGTDVTLVTYGSCVRVAQKAIAMLSKKGISVELIDVQTLLPFDLEHHIVESLKKTNRIVFLDEDVPGGASAYMMQEVLETQGGYKYLDEAPKTITAPAHRPPFGSDGDYFSKPNPEDVFECIYNLMVDAEPNKFKGFRAFR